MPEPPGSPCFWSPPRPTSWPVAMPSSPSTCPTRVGVEHAPEEIWQATQTAARIALAAAPDAVVRAVGITNQRETAVLWDRHTLAAPRRAIVWQDRRTAAICES